MYITNLTAILSEPEEWVLGLEEYGPITLGQQIRMLREELGQQEQARIQSLSLAKKEDLLSKSELDRLRRELTSWQRKITRLRSTMAQRLRELDPLIKDEHHAGYLDHRALKALAIRLLLWDQGAEYDGLDTALDDLTISMFGISGGADRSERMTLREFAISEMNTEDQTAWALDYVDPTTILGEA